MTLAIYLWDFDLILNNNEEYFAFEFFTSASHLNLRTILPINTGSVRLLPGAVQDLQSSLYRSHGCTIRHHPPNLYPLYASAHQIRHRSQSSSKCFIQTESSTKMVLFLILTLIGLVFSIYYIFLQYFVLLIEIILFVGLLIFNCLELIIGFFSCWQFQSYEKQQWFLYMSIKLSNSIMHKSSSIFSWLFTSFCRCLCFFDFLFLFN